MHVITQILLPLTLKASVIFLFIYMLTRIGKNSASVKYFIWQCFFLSLFILPFSAQLPTWQPEIVEEIKPSITRVLVAAKDALPETPVQQQLNSPQKASTASPGVSPPFIMTFVWIIGILYFQSKKFINTIRINKLISRAELLDSIRANRYRLVRLLISDDISTPMTAGIFKPVILLPTAFHNKSAQEQRFMIQHEMSHIHRHDLHMMVLVDLIVTLQWFNPFMWIARRQIILLREHASDDYVVTQLASPAEYAEMLLDIAQQVVNRPQHIQTAASMAGKSQLEGRLLAILDKRVKRDKVSMLHGLIIIALCILLTWPIATFSISKNELQNSSFLSLAEQVENSHVVESLLSILDDEDNDVRKEAFVTLGRIPGGESIKALEQALHSKNWDTRTRAAHRLCELGYSDTVAHIMLSFLNAEQYETRRKAARALCFNKNEQVRRALENTALHDPHPGVREDAVESLARIAHTESIPVLEKVLADKSVQVSEEAATALGRINTPSVYPILLNTLNHNQNRVRIRAIDALGDSQCRQATVPLISLLDDKDKNIRRECIKSLAQINDSRAVDAIINKLYDTDRHVREQAAEALGVICNVNALLPLTTALKDNDSEVREEAADALGNIYKKLNKM